MAAVRHVLKHVAVEQAKRRRKCHRKPGKHSIAQGESCLVIKDEATMGSKNYCLKCATEILDLAGEDLDKLRADLNS